MAFAQNLLEGFAQAAGDQPTVARIENEKADRVATQHEELAAQTQSILNDVTGLQQRRATLDPKATTYQADLAANDKALHDARQALTDLYHPDKNPGALNHIGGFIRQHLSKTKPQVTPAQAKQSMAQTIAQLDAAAAPPGTASTLSAEEKAKAERVAAGLEPRATAPKAEAENWQLVEITKPDGSKMSVQHNTKSNEFADLAGKPLAPEQLTGATVVPKASGAGPIRAWKKKGGKVVSVLVDRATNKEIPGSENADIQPPSNLAGRVTTGFFHYVDDNNQVHQIQETHTSMPAGAGIPTTPGEAKDRILGTKISAPVNKAQSDFQEATKLASVADQVAQKPNDAVNQKRLAVALERASAGRFTTQALDYIIKAGWGNTIEQWANNPTTGALPSDVLRQLVDGAHENLRGAQEALKVAHGPSAGGGTPAAQFKVPAGAPAAPKEDGHKLKANGQVIAISRGGQWVAP